MVRVWGKFIGAMLGFTVSGSPFGAIIGMAAGHAYDQRASDREYRQKPNFDGNARHNAYYNSIIILAAKLAKAGGKVTRPKIDAFKKVFHINPRDEARVGHIFDQARDTPEGFEPYAFNLAHMFVSHPAVLEEILSGLFLVAAAENNMIGYAESDFLRSVAYTFNFGPDDFYRIAARTGVRLPLEQHRASSGQRHNEMPFSGGAVAHDPYIILGINDKASNDDIKSAYKGMIRKHHPDKLIAEGMPQELVNQANEKMKRINVAYDNICKMRGIK